MDWGFWECGSKCVVGISGDADDEREIFGGSVLLLCPSVVGGSLASFLLHFPSYTSLTCARCCNLCTHSHRCKRTHVTWVSLFWFAAEIKLSSVTRLCTGDKGCLSRKQCECVTERMCVYLCWSVSAMRSFYICMVICTFSASLAAPASVCLRASMSVYEVYMPIQPPGWEWHSSPSKVG